MATALKMPNGISEKFPEIHHPLDAYDIMQAKIADAAANDKLGRMSQLNSTEKAVIQHYGLLDKNNQPVTTESLQQQLQRHEAAAAATSDQFVKEDEEQYAKQIRTILDRRNEAEQYRENLRQQATERPIISEAVSEDESAILNRAALDAVEGANIKSGRARRNYMQAFKDGAEGNEGQQYFLHG